LIDFRHAFDDFATPMRAALMLQRSADCTMPLLRRH
jgi:hypothetical protein